MGVDKSSRLYSLFIQFLGGFSLGFVLVMASATMLRLNVSGFKVRFGREQTWLI